MLSNEGRVGLFSGGVWSFAASNSQNNEVAEVACRESGHPGALSHYVTPSNDVSTLTDISCQGDEESLYECGSAVLGNTSANASKVLGVICEPRKYFSPMTSIYIWSNTLRPKH